MTQKMLDNKTIDQITTKLAHFLSDTFVLYVKTLNFHWNMVGPEFFMYHQLLQKQYEELAEASDELAERIRMLGRSAPGSMQDFLQLSCLKESPTNLSQKEMIQELVEMHEILVEHCHGLIKFTEEVLDQGTADLLIERIRSHSKQAWLLRSHLEKK
ncbi:MAG: DNA starvation/stationary phase protection protein [Chlamydiales bacterium]